MDLTSYLLGKERGGGGGSAVTSVNGKTGAVVLKTSDIENDSEYKKIIDIAITTTIDDGETEQLNNTDIATITAMAEDWYENIDKTQSGYFESELAKVFYGEDGEQLMSGIITYAYNNDGVNANVGIDINFGGFGDVYNCSVSFIVENDELAYDSDSCGYDYFVSYYEFNDVVGNINAVLDTLVTVEEGEE